MTTHAIKRVESSQDGQSWDVLEGEQIGPVSQSEISSVISAVDWEIMSPYFTPREVACKGTGQVYVHVPALKAYNRLRMDKLLSAHSPNSAYRAPSHNRAVGGSRSSRHLAGAAYDIPRAAIPDVEVFIARAKALGFNGFGFYRSFIHIDFRHTPARWNG